ncbi:MAG: hypothetical protein A3F17_02340 [Gammaproteobacteria bacterium RIFCSPHIGHO2_12_FULL_41_15]|nr:MAG: hypothetical protein A3F17_02340 [Gammaproteobacteria bacterium RIFCSPHIGHO2_12_FULL_41_15]
MREATLDGNINNELPVFSAEKKYLFVGMILSVLVWAIALIGTKGLLLLALPLVWLVSLFAHSALVAHLRGNAIRVSETQFPQLYASLLKCADRLSMKKIPECYLMNNGGMFNAFATHFLKKKYVVLMAPIIDSLQDRPSSLDFYLGHELGHIKRHHVSRHLLLLPFRMLPIAGLAYSRACEYTCDLIGLTCCDDVKDAQYGLTVLAAGKTQWKNVNIAEFQAQTARGREFWLSFHELTSSHPWLTNRCKVLQSYAESAPIKLPTKSFWAYIPALFIPNITHSKALNFLLAVYVIFFLGYSMTLGVDNALNRLQQQHAGSPYYLEHYNQ